MSTILVKMRMASLKSATKGGDTMARFVYELDEKAQLDIRKRFKYLKDTFGEIDDKFIEEILREKINITVPELEWQEWLHFDSDLSAWIDDRAFVDKSLCMFESYQEKRRKKFGYDYSTPMEWYAWRYE